MAGFTAGDFATATAFSGWPSVGIIESSEGFAVTGVSVVTWGFDSADGLSSSVTGTCAMSNASEGA